MKLFGRKSPSQPLSKVPPRKHHYRFAHTMLPVAFFDDPVELMAAFRKEGLVYLWFCWDQMGSTLTKRERLPKETLDFSFVDFEGKTDALVIKLPAPKGMTEAHYVALVHRPAKAPSTAPLTRVIALEHSADKEDNPMTCLCEWIGDKHINIGEGPQPTHDNFISAVRAVLASRVQCDAPKQQRVEVSKWGAGDTILDEYAVEKELGRGGMGRVWLVKSQSTGRRFAVKQALIRDDKHRKAFLTELQTWVDLPEHPNIVPCRFFRTVGDEIVIFADYVEGGSLADWIGKGKLTGLEQILDVAIQFAWGLHAIHERGLIHQDVKPGNVIMTGDGVPMVTDFGLTRARFRDEDGPFVSPALPPGEDSVLVSVGGMTPAYASPEQRAGQPLSRKTDIWSWGVSVLDMFMGGVSCRHGGHIAAEVLEAFIKERQEGARLPEVPAEIAGVLRKCFGGEDRLSDFCQVIDALQTASELTCRKKYSECHGVQPTVHFTEDLESIHDRYTRSPDEWLRFARHAAGLPVGGVPAPAVSEQGGLTRGMAILSEVRPLLVGLLAKGRSDIATEIVDASWVHADLLRRMGDWRGCLSVWEETVDLLSKVSQTDNGASDLLADTLYFQGQALADSGDPVSACRTCQNAMEILVRLPHTLPHLTMRAQVYQLHAKALQAQGRHEEASMDYRDSVATLQEFAEQFSENVQILRALSLALHNWAILQSQLNAPNQAIELYQRAIRVRETLLLQLPTDDLTHSLLAGSYSSMAGILGEVGNTDAALTAIERAIELRERLTSKGLHVDFSEGLAMAHINKGGLLLRASRSEEAFEQLSTAVYLLLQLVNLKGRTDLSPNLAQAEGHVQDMLAEASANDSHLADGMYAKYANRLRQITVTDALGESPRQLAESLSDWAGVKEALGRPDEAVSLLREAVGVIEGRIDEGSSRLRETFVMAHFNLGTALNKMGDDSSAWGAWETCEHHCIRWRAIQKGPPLLEWLGRASVALAYQLARRGDSAGAMTRLADVERAMLQWRGDKTRAIDAVLENVAGLREQIETNQKHDEHRRVQKEAFRLAEKALALRQKDQLIDALAHYRKALNLAPNDSDIWVNYGAACSAANDESEALKAFNRAVILAPGDATAWHNKGAILFQKGRFDEALPAFERAHSLGDEPSSIWLAKCRGMQRRQAREKRQ
jgi:serine/threonine protein kinase/tetratricopeptide (TPR) repeat protein